MSAFDAPELAACPSCVGGHRADNRSVIEIDASDSGVLTMWIAGHLWFIFKWERGEDSQFILYPSSKSTGERCIGGYVGLGALLGAWILICAKLVPPYRDLDIRIVGPGADDLRRGLGGLRQGDGS